MKILKIWFMYIKYFFQSYENKDLQLKNAYVVLAFYFLCVKK